MAEDDMVVWHHGLNCLDSEQVPGDRVGPGNLPYCSSSGHKNLEMTEHLN